MFTEKETVCRKSVYGKDAFQKILFALPMHQLSVLINISPPGLWTIHSNVFFYSTDANLKIFSESKKICRMKVLGIT
jgi:hypothetical protein